MFANLHTIRLKTPIGIMQAVATGESICLLEFDTRPELAQEISFLKAHFNAELIEAENAPLHTLKNELEAYFEGKLQNFTVKTTLIGTDFQQKVWQNLLAIPYGETRTYADQSIILGNLKAIRAVASANGKNKIALVIPCHRVIGTDGNLTGYAGGIERKRFLLELERQVAGPADLFKQQSHV